MRPAFEPTAGPSRQSSLTWVGIIPSGEGLNGTKRQRKGRVCSLCLTAKLKHWSSPALRLRFTFSARLVLRSSDSDLTTPLALLISSLQMQLWDFSASIVAWANFSNISGFIHTFPRYLFPSGSDFLETNTSSMVPVLYEEFERFDTIRHTKLQVQFKLSEAVQFNLQ